MNWPVYGSQDEARKDLKDRDESALDGPFIICALDGRPNLMRGGTWIDWNPYDNIEHALEVTRQMPEAPVRIRRSFMKGLRNLSSENEIAYYLVSLCERPADALTRLAVAALDAPG